MACAQSLCHAHPAANLNMLRFHGRAPFRRIAWRGALHALLHIIVLTPPLQYPAAFTAQRVCAVFTFFSDFDTIVASITA